MNRTLIPMITFSMCIACGAAEESYRRVAQSSLDGVGIPLQPVQFSFLLPSRSSLGLDSPLAKQKMTGYSWRIEGQGDKCQDSKIHESYGPYEDARTYAMELSGTCNYLVKILVGELASTTRPGTALELATTINYNDHIKPIVDKQCLSCHADYKDFSVVAKNASSIVSHVENETMPPKTPLDGSAIAMFLAWGDDGFQEKNPNKATQSAADTALSAIYYRNNNSDMIHDYELLGRTNFELRRSLWIQPDGEDLGLESQQIFTYRVSTP